MSNPWDSWSSNSDAWNAATYHWEDYYLAPSTYSASLTGYAPDNPNNHIVYPDSVNLTLNGISPDLGISFAPSIGTGSLSITGYGPVYAKGVFKKYSCWFIVTRFNQVVHRINHLGNRSKYLECLW